MSWEGGTGCNSQQGGQSWPVEKVTSEQRFVRHELVSHERF